MPKKTVSKSVQDKKEQDVTVAEVEVEKKVDPKAKAAKATPKAKVCMLAVL